MENIFGGWDCETSHMSLDQHCLLPKRCKNVTVTAQGVSKIGKKKEPGLLAQIQSQEFSKHNIYASGEMLYSKFSQHNVDYTRVDACVDSFGLDHKQWTIRNNYFNRTNYHHFVTMMFKMYKTKNPFLKLINFNNTGNLV